MKRSALKLRIQFAIKAFLILLVILNSCEKKTITIQKIDILTLPTVTCKNLETVFTDSGLVKLIMSAPLLEKFEKTESPYTEFKSGVSVYFYDGHKEPVAYVTSKYAKYTENNDLWELRDSVIAVSEENDRIETELLFWDQQKDLFYTDRFVRITDEDQVTMGTGLEYNRKLSKRKIKNVTATFYINDEQ